MNSAHSDPTNFTQIQNCLVATLPVLAADTLALLESALVAEVHRLDIRSVLIDCTLVEIMDSKDFAQLRNMLRAAEILGARCVVTGLRAGVVAHLVTYDVDIGGLQTAISLEDGLAALRWGQVSAPMRPA
jgi:anti-anti-sigma regulatory factor